MDLLDENSELDLFDHNWRIYSVSPHLKPQYISPEAEICDSLVNEGCTVKGIIHKSVLFQGVKVNKGAMIKESVIMPDVIIGENVYIERAIVPPHMQIPDNTVIKCHSDTEEVVLVTKEMLLSR